MLPARLPDLDAETLPWRNARYNFDGDIDLLIDHPHYGWIPFTVSPTDPMNYGKRLFWRLHMMGIAEKYTGGVPPGRKWPGPTPMPKPKLPPLWRRWLLGER